MESGAGLLGRFLFCEFLGLGRYSPEYGLALRQYMASPSRRQSLTKYSALKKACGTGAVVEKDGKHELSVSCRCVLKSLGLTVRQDFT